MIKEVWFLKSKSSNMIIFWLHELWTQYSVGLNGILILCPTNLEVLRFIFRHTLRSGPRPGHESSEKTVPDL